MLKSRKNKIATKTDEQLVAAIVNGCSDSFNEIYERYHKRLLYYFYRMLRNDKEAAQDFMQDIFFKLINKAYLFNPKRKFSTWIFSIAHNMCKNEYRGKEVRKIIVNTENPDIYYDTKTEENDKEQLIIQIFKELDTFDGSHKTAFLLKYREGFSIDEISEILDLPGGTVKSRLFYTRKKLQEKLNEKFAETIECLF